MEKGKKNMGETVFQGGFWNGGILRLENRKWKRAKKNLGETVSQRDFW